MTLMKSMADNAATAEYMEAATDGTALLTRFERFAAKLLPPVAPYLIGSGPALQPIYSAIDMVFPKAPPPTSSTVSPSRAGASPLPSSTALTPTQAVLTFAMLQVSDVAKFKATFPDLAAAASDNLGMRADFAFCDRDAPDTVVIFCW